MKQAYSPLIKPYAVFVGSEIYSQHKKRLDGESAYMKAKKIFPKSKITLQDSICFDQTKKVLKPTYSYTNVLMRNWFVEQEA